MLSFSQLSYSYIFVKWKKCNILPSFLLIHIVDSTFHHQPTAGGPPFSPERETCCMLSLISFRMLALCKKKTFRFTPSRIPQEFADSRQSLRPLPSLSRKGNVWHASLRIAFAFLQLYKGCYSQNPPADWLRRSAGLPSLEWPCGNSCGPVKPMASRQPWNLNQLKFHTCSSTPGLL